MRDLQIRLFGNVNFQMNNGFVFEAQDLRSPTLVKLFGYLAYHHGEPVSIQNIVNYLYGDTEMDNPESAVKNLIYRLRMALKKAWSDSGAEGDCPEFIITKQKAYLFLDGMDLWLDVEYMEQLWETAQKEEHAETQIELLIEAAFLYRGSFLSGNEDLYWVVTQKAYFQNLFMRIIHKLCGMLLEIKDYNRLEQAATLALLVDSLDEKLHYYLICSLIGQKKEDQAMEQYKKAKQTLFEGLGITNLALLEEAYKVLMQEIYDSELELSQLQEGLKSRVDGAFFCEYGIFKSIYQLELRRIERLEEKPELSLLSVTVREIQKKDALAQYMKRMSYVLSHVLRAGDVIAQYSKNQFVLLLSNCQGEAAQLVLDRIDDEFYRALSREIVEVDYDVHSYIES